MTQKKEDELYALDGKPIGGSAYDKQYFTTEELEAADNIRRAAEAGETSWDDAHSYVENIRKQYGYSGGDDGSSYNKLPASSTPFSYESAPQWITKYQPQIDSLMQEILGRKAFSYDPESDPLYQNYKEQYTKGGQLAMQDTLGQVSARTGGLASSYAGQAAQQTYNGYMSELAAKIPELYELAYEMYMGEDSRLYDKLNMLRNAEDTQYNEYLNALNQYNTDRSFAYGQYADDRAYDYQARRDELSDSRYEDETAYSRQQNEYERQLQQAQLMASLGDYSGYATLYGDDTAAQMQARYDALQQLGAQSTDQSSGYHNTSAEPKEAEENEESGKWSTVEDWVSRYGDDAAENYIAEHYKELGFSSVSAAKAGWSNHLLETGGIDDTKRIGEEMEKAINGINTYTAAVKYLTENGVGSDDISDLISRTAWTAHKPAYDTGNKDSEHGYNAWALSFDSYEDYLRAFVRWQLEA